MLALEAFKLAGDPKAFPEQFGGADGLAPWQPKRIFWNAFRGGSPARATLRLDIGGYIPLLGESVGEISALSRSSHRSQGYGSIATPGSRMDELQPLDGQAAGKDLFDGIDTTWGRWDGLAGIVPMTDDIIARFNPQNPAASVPALLELRSHLDLKYAQPVSPNAGAVWEKRLQLDRILQACLGLYAQTTVPQAEIVPGEPLKMRHAAMVGSNVPVRWEAVVYPGNIREKIGTDLRANQPVVQDSAQPLPADAPLSQPYWLRDEGSPGMYRVDDPKLIGQPENPPVFPVQYVFEVGGQELAVPVDPMQISADPVKGEVRRKLDVIAPVSIAPSRDVQLFAPGASRPVDVEIKAYRDSQNGTLRLDAPRRMEGVAGVAGVPARGGRGSCAVYVYRDCSSAAGDGRPYRECHHRRQNVRHGPA